MPIAPRPRPLLLALAILAIIPAARAGTLVELSAEAQRPAANDLLRATVYAEANAADPAEVAKRVNQDLGEALRVIKAKPGVTVKNGGQHTYPVYGGNRKLEGWRMHGDLQLESKDSAALSELLARLQQMKLALANVTQQPSPATRAQVEEGVIQDAIRAFEAKAALVARTLGKPYKIKRLSINQAGMAPPMPMLRAAAKMDAAGEAASMPLEAGESQVAATVAGEIELAD